MKYRNIFIATCSVLLISLSCTDIDENIYDKYAASEFYATVEGANAALAGVYAQVAGNWNGIGYAGADNGWYDLNEMSSDEQVIPHRTDGNWQIDFALLHQHEWLPSHPYILNTWNWLYRSVFEANKSIELLEGATADENQIAEAKVLRAFFYYLLIDDFGDVPFYTENNITVEQLPQESRETVYNFIVSELTANVDNLTPAKGGEYYGRFNRWAGYALLAKLYLNAEVYTGSAKWQECIDICNKIIDEGGFSLHPGEANASSPLGFRYYELFGDVLPQDETILAMFATRNVVSRNIFSVRSIYGPHGTETFGYSGWNGTIIPTPFYQMFSDDDIRKRQFLVGPQPGNVNYKLDVGSLIDPGADPQAGVRNVKFYPAGDTGGDGASNDFPIYRYADILLMKAESLVRLNKAAEAKSLVDQIRQRAGLEDLTSAPSLDDVYRERGLELNMEGHRRQDMIRFGTFIKPHWFKGNSPEYRNIFPIPTAALDANPKLKQNPGY
ncbi:MAG: RagB/SusD family nutrient uptake outer membrane protein [Chryseolinea sp.]